MKYTKTIRASKQTKTARRPVRASRAALSRKAVRADEEIEEIIDAPADEAPVAEEAEVTIDEDATELLFEAEDVAELISEVTELPVDVTVDEDEVVFSVGDDDYTVTPEDDIEEVAASKRTRASVRRVSASRRMPARRSAQRVSASRRVAATRKASAARRARK